MASPHLPHQCPAVTGEPLGLKDLIHLNWHKNAEGQYDCPVSGKVFTDHTHIVAIRTSGNVYAYESVRAGTYSCALPAVWARQRRAKRYLYSTFPLCKTPVIRVKTVWWFPALVGLGHSRPGASPQLNA